MTNQRPAEGELIGCWFDISLSDGVTSQHFAEHPDDRKQRVVNLGQVTQAMDGERPRVPRVCRYCHSPDSATNRHSKCAGCQQAYYCNRACQRNHWPEHKREHQCEH
jgi:hypothetical protein